jgi:hypothetical protein
MTSGSGRPTGSTPTRFYDEGPRFALKPKVRIRIFESACPLEMGLAFTFEKLVEDPDTFIEAVDCGQFALFGMSGAGGATV